MARTFNRRPVSVNGPDKNSIKNYTFNYEQWKGINDSKDFLAVDQLTFSDAQNMYIDSEGLLSSRPGLKQDTSFANWNPVTEYYEFKNDVKDTLIKVLCSYLVISDTIDIYDSAATAKVSATLTPNDAPLKYIDTYNKLYLFKGDNPMVVYDKSALKILTADEVSKLIYVPVTKTFTGSVENEGEGVNLLTTSERYLYYYSDANGINSDAIGKTLEWDGKTINWNDNVKPFLVKDHYDVGDSTVMAVAPSGAVAWVENNVLYYAVNGAIVYSWSLSSYIDNTHVVTRVKFNDANNTILVWIGEAGSKYHATYIVSCVSTKEDGSLSYPNPVELLSTIGQTPEPNIYSIVDEKFNDEQSWMVALLAGNQGSDGSVTYSNTIVYQYGAVDGELIQANSDNILAVDFSATYMVALSQTKDELSDYYKVYIWNRTGANGAAKYVGNKSYPMTIGRTTEHSSRIRFKLISEFVVAYLPVYDAANEVGPASWNAVKLNLSTLTTAGNQPVLLSTQYKYDYAPKLCYDNPLIALFNDAYYDCSLADFVIGYAGNVKRGTYLETGIVVLESTTNVFNYYKAVNGSNHIFTRFNNDTFELYYTKQGTVQNLNAFDVLYLNNYFFAVGNKLYITENKYDDDGQFLFYLPKKNVNEFDNVITKLHQIDESTVAVFFEDEIYYTTYDSEVGTYRYYKSKLQFGLRKGANVITSDDSVTTFFPTDRGIMALTYQNFVASSEQSTTPISDPVFNYTKDFLTGKVVKLYKKDFWIAAYNGSNTVWILDIRNGSWWRQELPFKVRAIWTKDGKPLIKRAEYINEANSPTAFTIGNTEYTDNGEHINWFFQSQKLHLSALNYYKSVQALTFFGVSDDSVCIFNLDTYAYRDNIYENASKSIEYGINMIRTYLYHLHVMKLHEFQFKVYADTSVNDPDLIHPIKLSNVAVRYRVSREVR